MLNKIRDYTINSLLMPALFLIACMVAAPVAATAQEGTGSTQTQDVQTEIAKVEGGEAAAARTLQPKWTDYKGVRIGMSMDEVRDRLDHLKSKGEHQDFFVFSDTESTQVFYDDEGKVRAISVTYLDDSNAPDATAVLGEQVEPQANGSLYKLVRYTDDGFWVAYSRTAGDTPLVTVTIQKM